MRALPWFWGSASPQPGGVPIPHPVTGGREPFEVKPWSQPLVCLSTCGQRCQELIVLGQGQTSRRSRCSSAPHRLAPVLAQLPGHHQPSTSYSPLSPALLVPATKHQIRLPRTERAGCILPSVMAPPALPRTPQHPPSWRAKLGLCSGPPGEESWLPTPVPPAPAPLSSPQPCSCMRGLQNLLEILSMQILASRPCQELELQSQEGSRLQARSPRRSPLPSRGNPLPSFIRAGGSKWFSGTPVARQVGAKPAEPGVASRPLRQF